MVSALNYRTVLRFIKMGAFVAPPLGEAVRPDIHSQDKVMRILEGWSGFNLETGKWTFSELKRGWLPYIITDLMEVGVPKIIGMIRRL